MLSKA